MPKHAFTHIGIISGDARMPQKRRVELRLTPSGGHWVTRYGKRFRRTGGGQVGQKWPVWSLDAASVIEKPDA